MKAAAFTTLAILTLLLASILCVGIRHFSDERRRSVSIGTGRTQSTPDVVDGVSRPLRRLDPAGQSPAPTLEMRLRALMAIANPADRRRSLLRLMDGFRPRDWPVAAAALRPANANAEAFEFQFLLEAWAEADPLAAMAWAGSETAGAGDRSDSQALAAVFRAWMAKDRDAAIAHLTQAATLDVSSRQALNLVAARSLGGDLPGLAKFLELIPGSGRAYVIAQGQVDFSGASAEDLKRWLNSLSPSLRKEVLAYAVRQGLEKAEQKRDLLESYPDDLGPQYQRDLYHAWAKEDPAAALASMEAIPPGPAHGSAVAGTGMGLAWIGRFPEALALARRFPDEVDNTYYNEILLQAKPGERRLAAEATSGIRDASYRFSELHTQLMFWFSEDPAVAREWLRTHEVPELLRQEYGDR